MEASAPDSLPESTDSEKAVDESQTGPEWESGPDLKPPGMWRRGKSIFGHTWKRHSLQIIVMVSALVFLIVGVLKWDVLLPPMHFQSTLSTAAEIIRNIRVVLFQKATIVSSVSPSNWADWWIRVQSFLGFGTLLVALFVWYGEIREDWDNDLPKRLSVFFFFKSRPAIVCRYVWLAGGDELRTWGQQVAKQAAGNENLDFSPDVEAKKPILIVDKDGRIYKHYAVRFELTKLPYPLTKNSDMHGNVQKINFDLWNMSVPAPSLTEDICRYQNFAAKDKSVHSIASEKVAKLDVVADWRK